MSRSDWSWEENKAFEMALAVIEEDDPEKWKKIASAIGGKRSVDEIEKQYLKLLKDLDLIESGVINHEFMGKDDCCKSVGCTKKNNHRLLFQLRMDEDGFSHITRILGSSKL